MRIFSPARLKQFAWALYDFANTAFSMNVISLYFALWVTQDQGGKDLYYSAVYSSSILLVILTAPLLGRWADRHGKRRFLLALFTLICVLATAVIGILNRLVLGLWLFFLANMAYQLALVFYDSLLPLVAPKKEYGRISGLGVSLGYLGSIAGILFVQPFVQIGQEVLRHRAFLPTACFFLLFALPCFFAVRKETAQARGEYHSLWKESWGAFLRQRNAWPYFFSMFLIQNAVTTVILFMGVYAVNAAGFAQKELNYFFILSTVVAFLSAYLLGHLSDRFGPRRIFQTTFFIWVLALSLAITAWERYLFWIVGGLVGIGLAGFWTSSRPLLLGLIGEEEAATFFGFNVLAGRFSSFVGPLIWGAAVWLLEPLGILRYRIAVGILLLFVIFGAFVSRRIPKLSFEKA